MSSGLRVSIGQHSDRGRKPTNQDFHGAVVPEGSALSLKGIAVALADGISPSPVSHIAAETAVKSFLADYYCTADSWTVETAAERVISATNSWLYGETRRSLRGQDLDGGYVCTFSALVVKARTAHLFHIGDARILRVSGESLEPLTEDHRVVVSGHSYLGRAMGTEARVAVDYRTVALAVGDILVLCTDGVHETLSPRALVQCIKAHPDDLDRAARLIVQAAYQQGSQDNLSVQIVRIESLPEGEAGDLTDPAAELPPAPVLQAPTEFEGYRVLRQIHANNRSHIYLAADIASGAPVALKIPSVELREDPALLRQFMMEEWVARRVDSPHVLKAAASSRPRRFLYVVTEHLEGTTLRQWMYDHPRPELETVRAIVEQLVKGLRALHRRQMVHCDLRPENVMIDADGLVKIIDFGSTQVAGLAEAAPARAGEMLGTLQYTAPECLAGDPPSWRSDLFSLGVIAYEMLSGRLPYGARAGRVRHASQLDALQYVSVSDERRPIPAWIDGALQTAVHPRSHRRQEALSEFAADLRTPNPRYARSGFVPLAERDPVRFWQGACLILTLIVLALLMRLFG